MSKVAPEAAIQEFDRMCALRRVESDEASMDDDDKAQFQDLKKKIVRAIVSGSVVVNEAGDPVFTPSGGSPLTFYRPTGATFMSMDSREGEFTKMAAAATEMTKSTPGTIAKLDVADFRLCCQLVKLFLSSR